MKQTVCFMEGTAFASTGGMRNMPATAALAVLALAALPREADA
jgi:uncharacterized protein (TIGR03382 family)